VQQSEAWNVAKGAALADFVPCLSGHSGCDRTWLFTVLDAHADLIDAMREFMWVSEDAQSFIRPGTVIDITDRQQLRRILPVMELTAEIATSTRKAA
jgi:hypothetical protein